MATTNHVEDITGGNSTFRKPKEEVKIHAFADFLIQTSAKFSYNYTVNEKVQESNYTFAAGTCFFVSSILK